MHRLLQNLRYSSRLLRKSPGFTAVSVITLALGIGAVTAMYTVLYAALLAPMPYPHPEQLVMVWSRINGDRNVVSAGDFLEWKRQGAMFQDMEAWVPGLRFNLATADKPEEVTGRLATPGWFNMQGYKFFLGRDFVPQEGEQGKDHVVVLSHRLWQRLGSDRNIIGTTIRLDGQRYTVVGVLSAGVADRLPAELTGALAFKPEQINFNFHSLLVVGRLKPGVSLATAQSAMDVVAKRISEEHPDSSRSWGVRVEQLRNDFLSPQILLMLWLLMGAVGFVLLIACANLANLLLARGNTRQKEVAIRASLGAGRRELFAQFMSESLVLAILGGAAGIGLAQLLIKAFNAIVPLYELPSEADVSAGGGVTFGGRTDQASFSAVTSNFFSGLGVKPALGRLILPSEGEKPGEPATLVLGYRYWKKRFGGDRDIVGKQVQLNGKPVEIIGVVPKEFHGMFSPFEMDGYLPLSAAFPRDSAINFWNDRNKRLITSLARLKPGVTMAQAQSLFDVISRREAEQHPASDKGFSVRVLPEKMARPIPYANSAFLVISALFLVLSAIVLLLACTNVANILMARASLRAREMAIRTALGGGRVRLIRQMLTETLLVTFLGGSLGLLLSSWMGSLISSIHFPNAPIQFDTSFDWRVFAYAFSVVLFAGIFAGFSFALKATKTDVNVGLQQSTRTGSSRHKVRKDLMVLQLAGSMTLLVIAGLFLRSLQNAEHLNLGFNPEHVLNVALDPQINNYTEAQTKEFYQRLEETVRPMPGVQSVSLASSVPITSFPSRDRVYLEGRASSEHQLPSILFNRVDPSYFQTMQIPLLLGRDFLDLDNEGAAPVAIVNQTMANRLWPGQEPIGKRFSMGHERGPFLEVVGVVRDSKYQTIAEDPQPYFYVPLAQSFVPLQILQIRSSGEPESLSSQIQQQIRALDPAITIVDIRTMNDSLGGATGFFMFRLGASIAAFMGILGLVLAVIGVYGMVSYATTQRTQEIGVRVALGADQKQILRLIIGQGMRIACIGIGIGVLAAWGLTRLTRHMLIGISASDPALYLEVATLVSIVALLACYLPARRAAKVDPMVALRYE